jgi:inorganic pyrophosphatase
VWEFRRHKIHRRFGLQSTEGEDGDPIDALILHDAATNPGLVLKCKIIGVLEVVQTEGGKHAIRNDRLIAVPRDSHREQAAEDARELPKQVLPRSRNSSSRPTNWKTRS